MQQGVLLEANFLCGEEDRWCMMLIMWPRNPSNPPEYLPLGSCLCRSTWHGGSFWAAAPQLMPRCTTGGLRQTTTRGVCRGGPPRTPCAGLSRQRTTAEVGLGKKLNLNLHRIEGQDIGCWIAVRRISWDAPVLVHPGTRHLQRWVQQSLFGQLPQRTDLHGTAWLFFGVNNSSVGNLGFRA